MNNRNPMAFTSNSADPSYVAWPDFKGFVAYGLLTAWPSHTDDLNEDWNHNVALDLDHVNELRSGFLDLLEHAVCGLWSGDMEVGEGVIDHYMAVSGTTVFIDDETYFDWTVTLQDDAIMFELYLQGDKPQDIGVIWLSYDAITDRAAVVKALREGFAIIGKEVWEKLEALATGIAPV